MRNSRWFASQLVVSIAATLCVAAFFPAARVPDAGAPAGTPASARSPEDARSADGLKSVQRVANGGVEQTVMRYEPQEQAALASLANFTPQAGPAAVVQLAQTPVGRTAPKAAAPLLPPRRPTLAPLVAKETRSAEPAAEPARPAAVQDWHVAGVDIPGSAAVRRYVPSGSDILATGSGAWSATASATRTVAQRVGGLLGL